MPQKTTLPLGAIMKIPYVGPAIVTGAVVYSVARKVWALGSQALAARSTKTRAAAPAADASSTAKKTATPTAPPSSPAPVDAARTATCDQTAGPTPRADAAQTSGTRAASAPTAAATANTTVDPVNEPLLATVTSDMRNLGAYVCIDSNIWMTPANEPFLRAFVAHTARAGAVLTLSGEQHEEIKHIKDSPDRDDAQRARARHADRLIASVCAAGHLVLGETRDRQARRDFDGYLAKRAATELKARRSAARVIVFTEDVQLTARLHSERTKAKAGAHQLRVLDARDLARLASAITAGAPSPAL